jgi:hypothetical protein
MLPLLGWPGPQCRAGTRRARACLAAGLIAAAGGRAVRSQGDLTPPLQPILQKLEAAAAADDRPALAALLAPGASPSETRRFADSQFRPGATRVAIVERDRQPIGAAGAGGYSLVVDAFMQYGDRARVATWRVDMIDGGDAGWRIRHIAPVTSLDGLVRLSINTTRQYAATDFHVRAEDVDLLLARGTVLTIDTAEGTTGLVLIGRGTLTFRPQPLTEQGQVRIFGGAAALTAAFDAAYVRVGQLDPHASLGHLEAQAVDARVLAEAEDVFRIESAKSYQVDLADLTGESWSLLPGPDDFLAEVRTRRYGTLTYSRAAGEPEDITLFDRRQARTIALYPSRERRALGRTAAFDAAEHPYDALDYDMTVGLDPVTARLDGQARMHLRVQAPSLDRLAIRLNDALAVQSIESARFGRLFSLRVPGQNLLLVTLPATVLRGTDFDLVFRYGGRLRPQPATRETLATAQDEAPRVRPIPEDLLPPPIEPSLLYSNRSYWYPQPVDNDFATATIRVVLPEGYACVASGVPVPASEPTASRDRRVYTFAAREPLRYFSMVAGRFRTIDRRPVRLTDEDEAAVAASPRPSSRTLDLLVATNSRRERDGAEQGERTASVLQYYGSIVGDFPYPTFTLAIVDSDRPGGHSPGFFAVLQQPFAEAPITWQNDPVAFAGYPEFFLAHEVAHQWWGQAVGWRTYHDQWLSEGLAQYFAALYARHVRGDDTFASVMRQMARSAVEQSGQGPIALGYRVGHIKADSRAFRAVVYNKSATVLHLLRRLIGDNAFFDGLRRFYAAGRYHRMTTGDLQAAMEAASGRPLSRFVDRWISGTTLPRLTVRYDEIAAGTGRALRVRVEQQGDVFDLPLTLTLDYDGLPSTDVVVPVSERVVEATLPLAGRLRQVRLSRTEPTMAGIRVERGG